MSDGDAPQRAIALFAFTPAEKDAQLKLALKKGDIVEVTEKVTAAWWKGVAADGRRGLFPATYVHALAGEQHAVALYDWRGTKDAHLSLHKGQELRVLSSAGAWWQGYTEAGAVGCFPGNYVRVIARRAPPALPRSAPPPARTSSSSATANATANANANAADGTYAAMVSEAARAEAAAATRKEELAERLRRMLQGDLGVAVEETDESRVERVFHKLDRDRDGKITRDELAAQLRRWERAGIDVHDAEQHFGGADADGLLDYAAFRAGVAALEAAQPRRQVVLDKEGLRKLFNHYDKDNTGRVERRRLKHLLKKLDWDSLGTTRYKVLRHFHTEVAGSQPIEFDELVEGIEQMAFSDLDDERRQTFFRVVHGKTARRRRVAAPGAATAGGGMITGDAIEQLARLLPQHRDETAASVRRAKMCAAFEAGLIRSNSMHNMGAAAKIDPFAARAADDASASAPAAAPAASEKRRTRKRSNSTGHAPAKFAPPIATDSVIVIDNGSSFLKVGVSGEEMPRFVVPAIVGQCSAREKRGLPPLFGYDALQYKGPEKLKLHRPLDPAKDIDWPRLVALWDHVFEDLLEVLPEEHHVLMTELPDMSFQSTRRLYELMFEYFEVQSLYVGNQGEMALFAEGIETGVVIDCGNRLQIVPVIEGSRQPHAALQLRVGAGNLNEFLARLITEHGNYFDPLVDVETLDRIKSEMCFVSMDPHADENLSELKQEKSMVLPSGKKVTLGSEAWRCPEGLFDPPKMGLDIPGVPQSLFNVVQKCPIDVRNELFSHIVLSGGSTLFPKFDERLRKEVRMLMNVASQRHLNIVKSSKRKYAAWLGASIFGSVDTFPSTTFFHEDYYDGELEKHLASQGTTAGVAI